MALSAEEKKALEARIRAFVGKPIGPRVTGRDAVNEPMIRQWCDAMSDANPVYLDADAAKQSPFGGIVAPPMMLDVWTMQGWEMHKGYDEPQNEEHRLHKILTDAGYTGVLGTDTEQAFHRYLRPGDTVSAEAVIEQISEEKSTGAGVGYFITTRTRFTDQRGDEIGWQTFRVLKFIPKEAPRAAAPAGAQPAKPTRLKPPMGHDNGWWWTAVAKENVLPIQRCTGCRKLRHPPRPMCDACGSLAWDHVAASGRGTLHSFTVIHHPQFPGYEFPIVAALVDLEEGERILSNLVGCDPKQVRIGMRVQCFIHADDDGFKLPLFRASE
jgi:uncharacterized OB-fold protein/acyl dehydratase